MVIHWRFLWKSQAEYARFAEEIADISYSQSETFSSVCIYILRPICTSITIISYHSHIISKTFYCIFYKQALLQNSLNTSFTIGRPKLPIRTKVVQAIICSSGKVVNVRTLVKNIREKATEIIKGNSTYFFFNLICVTYICGYMMKYICINYIYR